MQGPFETCTVVATRPLWVRLHAPMGRAVQEMAAGRRAPVSIDIQGVQGQAWVARRGRLARKGLHQPGAAGDAGAAPAATAGPPQPAGSAGSEATTRPAGLESAVGPRAAVYSLHGWIQTAAAQVLAGLANEQPAPAFGNVAEAALRDLGVALPPAFACALGRWLERHISALTLVPSPVLHWQWATTVWAWLLETVGIHRTVAANPELFENVLADVGITARARRMRPFSAWVQGRTSMEPGAGLPGMNAQGGRSFGLVRAPLTAATEQALSQLATQAREAAEVSAEARANLSAQRAASPHAAPHSLPRVASTTTLAERPSGHDVPGEGRRQQTGTLSVVPRRATTHGPATEGGVGASLEPSRAAASSRERAQRGGGPRRGRGRGRSASDGLNAQAQHNRRAALDEAAARRRTSPAAEGSTASAPGTAVLPVLGSEVALVTLEPVGIGQRFCGADSPPPTRPGRPAALFECRLG